MLPSERCWRGPRPWGARGRRRRRPLYRSERAPSFRAEATDALGALLLEAAAADAARGEYPSAILRLQEVERLAPGTAAALQAERQLPVEQAGAARALIDQGRPADAVRPSTPSSRRVRPRRPRRPEPSIRTALLAAAKAAIADLSDKEALTDLQRLVIDFRRSAQAADARALLGAPQSVERERSSTSTGWRSPGRSA